MKLRYPVTLSMVFFFFNSGIGQFLDFPDEQLKQGLLATNNTKNVAFDIDGQRTAIDTNQDGLISLEEADRIFKLNLDLFNFDIEFNDISGIENFRNLEHLYFRTQRVDTLRLNGHQNLRYINCGYNRLKLMKIEDMPNLDSLLCLHINATNGFHEMFIENLPSLSYLHMSSNRATADFLDDITTLTYLNARSGFAYDVDSLDLSHMPDLEILILDQNGLTNLKVIPNSSIKELNLAGNGLPTFDKSFFPEVQYLNLERNDLAELDVSYLDSLKTLLLELNGGFFTSTIFTTLKVTGCTSLDLITARGNEISSLDLSNLPKLRLASIWDNPLTSVNLRNTYSLEEIYIDSDLISELDFSCSPKIWRVDADGCSNLQTVNFRNGAIDDPRFFSFDLNALIGIGVDHEEYFDKFDITPQSPYVSLLPTCKYYTITGNIQHDLDSDDCDDNDPHIPYNRIDFGEDPFNIWTHTRKDGSYTIYSRRDSLTLRPVLEESKSEFWTFASDSIRTVEFENEIDSINVDMCLIPLETVDDVEVVLFPLNEARPGFETEYNILYRNVGNSVLSGIITLNYLDSLSTLIIADPEISSSLPGKLVWQYENILPFEERSIEFTLLLNSPMDSLPLSGNDSLVYKIDITPVVDDVTPENNSFKLWQDVINSFDPNDIRCLEGDYINIKDVGGELHYLIRFENLGNASAINIVVRNEIDLSLLDIQSLQPLSSSHSFFTNVDSNIIEFFFEDIHLPFEDDLNDGYILYKIKSNTDLLLDDTIVNEAAIYFDFNFPVFTGQYNTLVTDRIVTSTSIEKESPSFRLFPNPASTYATIRSEDITEVVIYDLNMHQVLNFTNLSREKEVEINVSDLTAGLYVVSAKDSNGRLSQQLLLVN